MTWITLSGLIVLTVVLILAIAFEAPLDKRATRVAILAALFLSLSLIFHSTAGVVTDDDVAVTLSVLSSIAAGLAWFFILVGLVRFAGAQRPGEE
jgi:hypothetical protein